MHSQCIYRLTLCVAFGPDLILIHAGWSWQGVPFVIKTLEYRVWVPSLKLRGAPAQRRNFLLRSAAHRAAPRPALPEACETSHAPACP